MRLKLSEQDRSDARRKAEAFEGKAAVLKAELQRFADEEYPAETKFLRDIFEILLDYVTERITVAKTGPASSAGELHERLHILGGVINELYAKIRYLRASGTVSTPPALQGIVRSLVKDNFQSAGGVLTIVRPQWNYNCKFVSLTLDLGLLLNHRSVLIPDGIVVKPVATYDDPQRFMLTSADVKKMLEAMRKPAAEGVVRQAIPESISVLSVAGLDRDDVLLYPMIGHEVAHKLSFQTPPGEHQHPTHHSQVAREIVPSDEELRRYAAATRRTLPESRVPKAQRDLRVSIGVCVRELIADLAAVRMLGVGFFLTLEAYLSSMFKWDDPLISADTNYPSMRFRLRVVWDHLKSLDAIKQLIPTAVSPVSVLESVLKRLDERLLEPLPTLLHEARDQNAIADKEFLYALAAHLVIEKLDLVVEKAKELVPTFETGLDNELEERVQALRDRLPPLPSGPNSRAIPPMFTAAWLYRLEREPFTVDDQGRLNRLVTKGIELACSDDVFETPKGSGVPLTGGGGVLTGTAILARTKLDASDARRISIVPMTVVPETASVEVSLGHWFKVARRPKVGKIDLAEVKRFLGTGFLHDEFYVEDNNALTLHAGDFALGITREFIGMPRDAMAFVEGKSSLGRTGLIVATATQVAPGFHGCLVLELVNAGSVPLEVRPRMPVAQLVFITTSAPVSEEQAYRKHYDCQIKP
ncbi:MAG TPA: dCTP deaminase [Thermoanaerobaculia bacterium]|nr:dCTP deaminase [Thermoanaerobaculia bacterium]